MSDAILELRDVVDPLIADLLAALPVKSFKLPMWAYCEPVAAIKLVTSPSNAVALFLLVATSVAIDALSVVSASVANVLTDALTVFNSASLAKVASKLLEKASLAVTLPASEELKVVVDPEIAVALAAGLALDRAPSFCHVHVRATPLLRYTKAIARSQAWPYAMLGELKK